MSYSINEEITDTEDHLKGVREVQKRYPDAKRDTKPGGESVIVSSMAKSDTTRVIWFAEDRKKETFLGTYVKVGSVHVFSQGAMSVGAAIASLEKEYPDAYAKLVDVVRKGAW